MAATKDRPCEGPGGATGRAFVSTAPTWRAALAAGALLVAALPAPIRAEPDAWPVAAWRADEARYRFSIVDQPLRDVLREFGAAAATPIVVGNSIDGRVSGVNGSFTLSGFLDEIARRHALAWYHDGEVLHVSEASEMRSIVVDLGTVPRGDLVRALRELGLEDPRYPVRAAAGSNVGILTAPPRYAELVENAFVMLSERPDPIAVEGPDRRAEVVMIRASEVSVWRGAADAAEGDAPRNDAAGDGGAGADAPQVDARDR